MEGGLGGWMHRLMVDGLMDGLLDGCMEGGLGGWMDACMHG